MIVIENTGPLVRSTDYWRSDLNRAGGFFLSLNAGVFRLLVPSGWESELLLETRTASGVVVSRGPWADPPHAGRDTVELLFEDGTDSPYSIHLDAAQCPLLPPNSESGRACGVALWIARRGKPHCSQSLPANYRVVGSIPCLKPFTGGSDV